MEFIKNGVVFSNDINLIINGKNALKYFYTDKGILVPDKNFIEGLRRDFIADANKYYEMETTVVSEEEMTYWMKKFTDEFKGEIPIISMDEIYIDTDEKDIFAMDCTRYKLNGKTIMVTRKDSKNVNGVEEEVKRLSELFKKQNKTEIILLDDVVFSGSVVNYLSSLFSKYGVKVVGVRAAISTNEGYENFKNLKYGLKCGYLMSEDVIDEICERDFYYGIAQSGSTEIIDGVTYKKPYFLPFGNPVDKASVPSKNELMFSNGCVRRSIDMFQEMEKLSKKKIYNRDLPELIYKTDKDEEVIKTLKKSL